MENIFKFNFEDKTNYIHLDFNEIKNKLKNLRLNITEEIRCITFIKQRIESKENINEIGNPEINDNLLQKYLLIFNKLNELCIEEINYISEIIIDSELKIKEKEKFEENKNYEDFEINKNDILYDKIDLCLNNYNKILDNLNKTISSIPYIFNLYLLYNKIDNEENNYIRNNIKNEEMIYNIENNTLKNQNKIKCIKKDIQKEEIISKRQKMINFSKSVKSLKVNRLKLKINNSGNTNKEKSDNIINNKSNLRNKIKEIESKKEDLMNFIFSNCIKEDELKNLNNMKKDNQILTEELECLKNSFIELSNSYKDKKEILEKLYSERNILEKENIKLIEYINQIFSGANKNIDIAKS
jgi:hypothetical protein